MGKAMLPHPSPRASGPATTFVRTDTATFKEIVQWLTGLHDEAQSPTLPSPPYAPGIKGPTFKLQERRKGSRPKLTITKPKPSLIHRMSLSPRGNIDHHRSPCSYLSSQLISPCNGISRLRLNGDESLTYSSLSSSDEAEAKKKAVEEKRFYLYSSPRGSGLGTAEPELLHLFPLLSEESEHNEH